MAEETKKTVRRAGDAPQAAEKKTSSAGTPTRRTKTPTPSGNPTVFRILAFICWIAALACEFCAILIIMEKLELPMTPLTGMIIFLVVDLILCIVGSQLWKRANRIDPASEKNKFLFWLWNNMGMIAAAVCFLPFIILALSAKNVDKKTKAVATVVAVICLLIAGLFGYDWNPISEEQKASAVTTLDGVDVYWSNFGHRYHIDEDCSSLGRSSDLTVGSVQQAIEANRTNLCKFCFNKNADKYEGLEGLIADAN